MESHLHSLGIKKVGDLARLEESELSQRFGKWGLALAGKARGEDAGGWFDSEVGADIDAKSISHEHTYNEDTADPVRLESTLMRLSEMVGRRLREADFHARTVQLKLRYKDFTTITRAHTLASATELDTEIFEQIRALFRSNWKRGCEVRLLGVQVSSFSTQAAQMDLLDGNRQQRWKNATRGRRQAAGQVWRIQRRTCLWNARQFPASVRMRTPPVCRGKGRADRSRCLFMQTIDPLFCPSYNLHGGRR